MASFKVWSKSAVIQQARGQKCDHIWVCKCLFLSLPTVGVLQRERYPSVLQSDSLVTGELDIPSPSQSPLGEFEH